MLPKISYKQRLESLDLIAFDQIFSLYFFKFIAGDKNTVSGFADIAIDELYLWAGARVGSNRFVKTVCSAVARFNNSLKALSQNSKLTLDDLIAINTRLRPKKRNYGIRTSNMRAGNPKTNANAFYCIAPQLVKEYLDDLIDFINSDVKNDANKALLVLQQFIFIHPFSDGNGRLSRLLLLKILQEKHGLIYSCLLSIYLKNINRDNYHKAVSQYQQNDVVALQQFYNQAIQWTNQSAKILSGFIQEYTNKVGQQNIGSDSNYLQVVIKTKVNQKLDESVFQPQVTKGQYKIYFNTALLNALNQFDYYLRFELRSCMVASPN